MKEGSDEREELIEAIVDKIDEDMYKHQVWLTNYAIPKAIEDWTDHDLKRFLEMLKEGKL